MEKFASDSYADYRKIGEMDLLANPGGRKRQENMAYPRQAWAEV